MQLQSFLHDNVNLVEHYFCPTKHQPNENILQCGWTQLPKLPLHYFKNRLDQEIVEYCHRDLIYSYDYSNDAQRVYQKNWLHDCVNDAQYTVSFQEESLPIHRFPCTTEINEKRTLHRVHYKINNRMFFVVEKEEDQWVLYLKYQHVSNIDIDKMNEDWNQAIQQLSKMIYRSH